MKTNSRVLAFILSLAMILSIIPIGTVFVSAADYTPGLEAKFIATDLSETDVPNYGSVTMAATCVEADITSAGSVELTVNNVLPENILSLTVSYTPAKKDNAWNMADNYTTSVSVTATGISGRNTGSFVVNNNQIGTYNVVALTRSGSLTLAFEIMPQECTAKFGGIYYSSFKDALVAANNGGSGELAVYKDLGIADYDVNPASDVASWGRTPSSADYNYETNNGWFFNNENIVLNLNYHNATVAAAKDLSIRNAGSSVQLRYIYEKNASVAVPCINIENANADASYTITSNRLNSSRDYMYAGSAERLYNQVLLKGAGVSVDNVSVGLSGVMAYSAGTNKVTVADTTSFPYGVVKATDSATTHFAFYKTAAEAYEHSTDGLVYVLSYQSPSRIVSDHVVVSSWPEGLMQADLRTVYRKTDGNTSAFYIFDEDSNQGIKWDDNSPNKDWPDTLSAGDFRQASLNVASTGSIEASRSGVSVYGAGGSLTESSYEITRSGVYSVSASVDNITISGAGLVFLIGEDGAHADVTKTDEADGGLYLSGSFGNVTASNASFMANSADIDELKINNSGDADIINSNIHSIAAEGIYDFNLINSNVSGSAAKLIEFNNVYANIVNSTVSSVNAEYGIYASNSSISLSNSLIKLDKENACGIYAINSTVGSGMGLSSGYGNLEEHFTGRDYGANIAAENGSGIIASASGVILLNAEIRARDYGVRADNSMVMSAADGDVTSGVKIYADETSGTAIYLSETSQFISLMFKAEDYVLSGKKAIEAVSDAAIGQNGFGLPINTNILAGTFTGDIVVAGETTSIAVFCSPYNIGIVTEGNTSIVQYAGADLIEYLMNDNQSGPYVMTCDMELNSALFLALMLGNNMEWLTDEFGAELFAILGIPVHGENKVIDFNGHKIVTPVWGDGEVPFVGINGIGSGICTFFVEDGELQFINSGASGAGLYTDSLTQVLVLNGKFVNGLEDGSKGVDFMSSTATHSSIAVLGALGQVRLYGGEYRGLVVNLLSDMIIYGGTYHGVLDAHLNMRYRGGKFNIYGGKYYNPTIISTMINEFRPGVDSITGMQERFRQDGASGVLDLARLTENGFEYYTRYVYGKTPAELFGLSDYNYVFHTEGAIKFYTSLSAIFIPMATVYADLLDPGETTAFIGGVMPADAVLTVYSSDGAVTYPANETILSAGALGPVADIGLGVGSLFGLSTISNTHSSYDCYMTVNATVPEDNPQDNPQSGNGGSGGSGGSGGGSSAPAKQVNEDYVALAAETFKDVKSTDYFAEAVGWAYANNITAGITPELFAPDRTCKRCEVVTFLWKAAGSPEPKTKVNPFKDVKESDYYYKSVLWAYENNITSGFTAEKFGPGVTCSNAHILTFLNKAMDAKSERKAGDKWYDPALRWAKELKLIDGTYTVEFNVNEGTPRANIIVYLYRYFVR